MNMNWNEECKDREPGETVAFCQTILAKMGIEYNLYWGKGNVVKSVKIKIKDGEISSDGKGITSEYALASAYGEFLERLLNGVCFRMNSDILQVAGIENECFYYLEMEEIQDEMNSFISLQKDEGFRNPKFVSGFVSSAIDYLQKLYNSNQLICNTYKSLTGNKIRIPCGLVDILYGTNGMCAGNTMEEALVQGVSEIFERHTINQILNENITLHNVTKALREKFTSVDNYIDVLEGNKDIKIIVYQCEQLINIPAFVLVYINKSRGTYIVKVGVHLYDRIAVERCFTELLQGKSEDNVFGLSVIHKCNDLSQRNRGQIFQDGRGNYPFSIFASIGEEEELSLVESHEFQNNKDILRFYYDEITKSGYEILISDVSINGFSAFHVIIPGMSETLDLKEFYNSVPGYLMTMEVVYYIKKIESGEMAYKEIEHLYEILKRYSKSLFCSLNVFLKQTCVYNKEKLEQVYLADILIFCLSSLKKYEELKKVIAVYIEFISRKEDDCNTVRKANYYSCLLSFLKYGQEEILANVYGEKVMNMVKMDLKHNFVSYCKVTFCDQCPHKESNSCRESKLKNILSNVLKEQNKVSH